MKKDKNSTKHILKANSITETQKKNINTWAGI